MVVLFFLLIQFHPILFQTVAKTLVIDEPLVPSDYIVVLGGGLLTRPFKAAELYHQKMARKIILFSHCVNIAVHQGISISHDELNVKVLVHSGVNPDDIYFIEKPVQSTFDEARQLKRFIENLPVNNVIVVTTKEHTRRTKWVFDQWFDDDNINVMISGADHENYSELNWWKSDVFFLTYFHEMIKLPVYYLKYSFMEKDFQQYKEIQCKDPLKIKKP